jgi:hypothetical protein
MPRTRNFYPAFIGLSFFPLPKSLKNCSIHFLFSGTPDANHYHGQV